MKPTNQPYAASVKQKSETEVDAPVAEEGVFAVAWLAAVVEDWVVVAEVTAAPAEGSNPAEQPTWWEVFAVQRRRRQQRQLQPVAAAAAVVVDDVAAAVVVVVVPALVPVAVEVLPTTENSRSQP